MNIRDFVKDSLSKFAQRVPSNPPSEHVYFVCRAHNMVDDSGTGRISTEGGKLFVKTFNPATCECGEKKYTIPSNGVVEVDIPYGVTYQAHTELSGYGASCRVINRACNDKRYVHLWNLPLGVYSIAYNFIYGNYGDNGAYRCMPLLSESDDFSGSSEWDIGNGDIYDYEGKEAEDDYAEDMDFCAILVSTAKSSFALYNGNIKADTTLKWSEQNYGRSVPGLPEYYTINNNDWDKAIAAAEKDLDGALNTEKILDAMYDAPAAQFAAKAPYYVVQNYLPSAGELKLIYNNKSAINSLASTLGYSWTIDNDWYWSSCVYDVSYSFYCLMDNGDINGYGYKNYDFYVLRVSAFTMSSSY